MHFAKRRRSAGRRTVISWCLGVLLLIIIISICVWIFVTMSYNPDAPLPAQTNADITPLPTQTIDDNTPLPTDSVTQSPAPSDPEPQTGTEHTPTAYSAYIDVVQNRGISYIDISKGYHVDITQEIRFTNNTGASLWELYIRLYPNAVSPNCAVISELAVDGTQSYYESLQDGELIKIPLTDELLAGERTTIYIKLRVDVPEANGRFGLCGYGIMLGGILPQMAGFKDGSWQLAGATDFGDPFYWQSADYSVTLRSNSKLLVAASAEEYASSEEDGYTVRHYRKQGISEFAIALCKDFWEYEFEVSGQKVVLFTNGYNAEINQVKSICEGALSYYIDEFGPLPYERLCIVRNSMDGAMEYPGLIMLSSRFWFPKYRSQAELTLSHELAHQFFGCAVEVDQYNDAYIDEGLATLCSYLYVKKLHGEDYMRRAFDIEVSETDTDGVYHAALNEFGSRSEYEDAVYGRASMRLMARLDYLGEDKLLARLRSIYVLYCGKHITPAEFEQIVFTTR